MLTQMHVHTQIFFLFMCGNNKNKGRKKLVIVEHVMNITIFYKEKN
jgi:hypothetical protein